MPDWQQFSAAQLKQMRKEMLKEAERVLKEQGLRGGRLRMAASRIVDSAMRQEQLRVWAQRRSAAVNN